jgi:DNA-directed RNA polymerase specialized sigma subunit
VGAVGVDIHKNAREIDCKYALDTTTGVEILLADVPYLKERRYIEGDFDAAVILADLEKAFEIAAKGNIREALTAKQRRMLELYHIEGYNLREIGEMYGVSHQRIDWILSVAIERLTKVFRDWDYGEL